MTRTQIHNDFVAEFKNKSALSIAIPPEFGKVEQELGTMLPQAYCSFIQAHGAIRTPTLLNIVVDSGTELWAINSFIAPCQLAHENRLYWSGGMSDKLIGFAEDSMGNMFCFRRRQLGTSQPDDTPVWFFDHDFCKESQLSETFDGWLLSYLKFKRGAK